MPKSQGLQIASGSYTGTGSAVEVKLGFKPRRVEIFNNTDGDDLFIHFEGMSAGDAIKSAAAISKVTTNGISLRNYGFTAGSDCSESAKVMLWFAFE